ncbi:MAG: 2-oxoacid:acceptor oxidoreductase subunit alpha [Theionarchaea archaeon]|nr:MAG: 2-oxoglutarate ferredoxin oxidoreductase subunit alpha [Theionarchaea archaeon DG-70-1]MBU7030243.1 2-oxoacid:acceptor oxidoreductase subunit alpha [Theionarchaea archaeon]
MELEEIKKVLGPRVQFEQGDITCAYGALLAGCTFFGGYPITPATETAEAMSQLLPRVGGVYIQMEDEIASISAVIGASWAGAKAMTATSGPGFSLMMENIGYACMSETPCVIVNVQRSGPSTGQPTMGAQGDMLQARWGTHGDHEVIAFAPNSVQEVLDLTIHCFNMAEKYRVPVMLMTDADVGHMREKIVIPDKVETINRVPVTIEEEEYVPFRAGYTHKGSLVPEFAPFGSGYKTYVTGLTHDERGLPVTDNAEVHTRMITRIVEKITKNREKITMYEEKYTDDCDIAVVSYGITSRSALTAVEMARNQGIKAGYFRMISVWPFPIKQVKELGETVKKIYVPEMNLGQMIHPIREYSCAECIPVSKIGGEVHQPTEILHALK